MKRCLATLAPLGQAVLGVLTLLAFLLPATVQAIQPAAVEVVRESLDSAQPQSKEPGLSQTGEAVPQQSAVTSQRRIWLDAYPERSEAILRQLDASLGSAGFDFQEIPLEELVAFVEDTFGFEIILDSNALDEAGIGTDEPVTSSLKDAKLGVALESVLRKLSLTYAVRDGVLTITSENRAQEIACVAIYPVRDLFGSVPDYAALVATIQKCLSANATGDVQVMVVPQRGALVVSGDTAAHQSIQRLIAGLREAPLDDNWQPPVVEDVFGEQGLSGGGQF
ncbi:DUF4974 domain-containing protein [Botrimarina hoheduenensis]|uniref:DUF4974 domain-containing protein n=1 Tax=Botrimarina hoheduenensis TaxID=2528000 RepID=UPI0011B83039|nr:DUF4974 domain-containing protein [Botrimarina hoheduenensis]